MRERKYEIERKSLASLDSEELEELGVSLLFQRSLVEFDRHRTDDNTVS